eukprot:Skav211759  [mRNA]  locus=scaffold674:153517:159516:+ [translate_table: standard]
MLTSGALDALKPWKASEGPAPYPAAAHLGPFYSPLSTVFVPSDDEDEKASGASLERCPKAPRLGPQEAPLFDLQPVLLPDASEDVGELERQEPYMTDGNGDFYSPILNMLKSK